MKTNTTIKISLFSILLFSVMTFSAQKSKKSKGPKTSPELFEKIRNNDATGLKALIDGGINPNDNALPGNPALYTSASWYADCAKVLIDAGADANGANAAGQLPSHAAANWGNDAVLKLLREKNADFSSLDNSGVTPFQYGAQSCKAAVVEELLSGGALKGTNVNSLLMEYILLSGSQQERVDHVQKNLTFWKTANVKILDWMTNTDPNYFSSPSEVIAVFKKYGADLNAQVTLKISGAMRSMCSANASLRKTADLTPAGDAVMMTPIELAVRTQKQYMMEGLLANGARISDMPGGEAKFLWILADKGADFNTFKSFYEKYTPNAGAPALMSSKTDNGNSAYQMMFKTIIYNTADANAIKWFLSKGCDASKFSDASATKPLAEAENGVYYNETPFSYALLGGRWYEPDLDSLNVAVLKVLLEAKANPNALFSFVEHEYDSYETARVKGEISRTIYFTKSYIGFLRWYNNVHFGEKNEDWKFMKKKLKNRLKAIEVHTYSKNSEVRNKITAQIAEVIALLTAAGATGN